MNIKTLIFIMSILAGCVSTTPPRHADIDPTSARFAKSSQEMDAVRLLDPLHLESIERSRNPEVEYKSAISLTAELQLGMGKQGVQLSLGSPSEVEVAGHPKYGNERWTYQDTIATPNGYLTATKYIYFENHQVVGWETD